MAEENRDRDLDIDHILQDIEADKIKREQGLEADSHEERLSRERQAKVSGFKLDLQLDEEYGDLPAEDTPSDSSAEGSGTALKEAAPIDLTPLVADDGVKEDLPESGEDGEVFPAKAGKKKKKKASTTWGCIRGLIYAAVVLVTAGTLAYFAITGGIDLTGLNKSDALVDVVIPQGASTEVVAEILKENGLIDQPLVFRLYSKLTHADGKYQPGTFSLTPNMGYQVLIETLQTAKARETVSVTIPEGYTLDKIAALMEEKEVCTKDEFYRAATQVEYDYDFLNAIPDEEDGEQYSGRIYQLEGYLFPDTYDFYTNSSGETVIRKLLDNFDNKLDATVKAAAKAKDMTIDQVITLASIIQGEAANNADMLKVSRVLQNRLANPGTYPKLECDATRKYVNDMIPGEGGGVVINKAYDTYEREGLPVGPINNPGMAAINAVLNPSTDETVMECYFFATAYIDGVPTTFYSKTLKEHERICKKYGIGMYA